MLAFLESLTGEVPEWAGRPPHLPPAGSEGLPETQPTGRLRRGLRRETVVLSGD